MPGEYSLNCFNDWSRRGKLNARKHSKLSFSSSLNRYLHLQILERVVLFLFHDILLYCSEEQENHVRTKLIETPRHEYSNACCIFGSSSAHFQVLVLLAFGSQCLVSPYLCKQMLSKERPII